MLDQLSDKFASAIKTLRGKSTLTESNVESAN